MLAAPSLGLTMSPAMAGQKSVSRLQVGEGCTSSSLVHTIGIPNTKPHRDSFKRLRACNE